MRHYRKPVQIDPQFGKAVSKLVAAMEGYFNITYSGLENIPIGQRFIWTHNHSGWPSLDSVVIGKKIAEVRAQHGEPLDPGLGFWHDIVINAPVIGPLIRRLGCIGIHELAGYPFLENHDVFAIPAEGEAGNFKSSFRGLYRLSRFKAGIGRVACRAEVPWILPVAITGPEESFPLWGRLRIPTRELRRRCRDLASRLGFKDPGNWLYHKDILLPLLFPLQGLPVDWRVHFGKPVTVAHLVAGERPGFDQVCYRRIAQVAMAAVYDNLQSLLEGYRPYRLARPFRARRWHQGQQQPGRLIRFPRRGRFDGEAPAAASGGDWQRSA